MPDLRQLTVRHTFVFALLLALALLVANVVALPAFGAPGNWVADLRLFAPFALVAMASTPAIISGRGGLDISVGPLATLISVVLVVELLPTALGTPALAIPILLGIGAAIGLVNGFLITVLRYQPVIATLCSFLILGGLALAIAPQPVTPAANWTSNLAGMLGPIPGPLLLIAAPPLIWLGLRATPYVRQLYAVGANDAAAFSAGVNVVGVRLLAYMLDGIFAALAGIALTLVTGTADATLSVQYTLVAIAAVVLGGTPIGGGRGGLLGSILGAAVIYLLQNLLSEINVSSTWLQAVYGAMLIGGLVLGAQITASARAAVAGGEGG